MAAPSVLGALASAIRDRLLAGEPAALPGLGQIGRTHVPARVQTRADGTKMLLPPSETVGLVAGAADAAPLAAVLQRHLGTTEGDPAAALRQAVDQLEAHLAATGEVRLPAVGVFQRTSSGIRFGADPDLLASVNRAYDGLEPVGAGDTPTASPPPPRVPPASAAVPPPPPGAGHAPVWASLAGTAAPAVAEEPSSTPAPTPPETPETPETPEESAPAQDAVAPPVAAPDLWSSLASVSGSLDDAPSDTPASEPETTPDAVDLDLVDEVAAAAAEPQADVPPPREAVTAPHGDAPAADALPDDATTQADIPPPPFAAEPARAGDTPRPEPPAEQDAWASDTWTTDASLPPSDPLGTPLPIEDADFSLVEPEPVTEGAFEPDASASWLAAALEEVEETPPSAPPLPRPDPAVAAGRDAPLGVLVDRVPPSPTDLDAIAAGPAPNARRRWTGLLWALAAVALIVTAVLLLLPPAPVPTDDDTDARDRALQERLDTPSAAEDTPLLAPDDPLGPVPLDAEPALADDPTGGSLGTPDATVSGGGTSPSAEGSASAAAAPSAAAGRRTLGRAPAAGQAIFPPRLAGLSPADVAALSGRTPVTHGTGGYTWVVLSSPARAEAAALETRYRDAGYRTGLIVTTSGGRTSYRVVVGQFDDREHALRLRDRLPPQAPPDTWPLDLR